MGKMGEGTFRFEEYYSQKAACCSAAMGFFLHLVGSGLLGAAMGTNYWLVDGNKHCGLFTRECIVDPHGNRTDWAFKDKFHQSSVALIAVGAALALASILAHFAWFGLMKNFWKGRRAAMSSCLLGLFAGIFVCAGAPLSIHNSLAGYSAWLALASGIVFFVNGIISVSVASCEGYYYIPSGIPSFELDDRFDVGIGSQAPLNTQVESAYERLAPTPMSSVQPASPAYTQLPAPVASVTPASSPEAFSPPTMTTPSQPKEEESYELESSKL